MSNWKARQNINKQYANIKGASSINDVAEGFGKGWVVFAVLSSMASAFSFYQDFEESLGVIATTLIVIALAVALEAFKHLSIKGMFSSMHIVSRSLVSVVAIGLIGISFYTHYKSIQTFQKNLVTHDLRGEIKYQRDIQKVQNSQIESILATNHELAKAINNGDTADDVLSSRSQQSNNELIKTLQTLAAQNNATNTNLLLAQSRDSAKTTASAILVIFIMIEIMALFSILGKVIIIDNVSDNVKEFFGLMDRLDELESNTYDSLGHQKMEQSAERIGNVQKVNDYKHNEEMKRLQSESRAVTAYTGQQSDISTVASKFGLSEEDLIKMFKSYVQNEKPKPQPLRNAVHDQTSNFLAKITKREEVECEVDDSIGCTETANTTQKALDFNVFDSKELAVIKMKWGNGMIEEGDLLINNKATILLIMDEFKMTKSQAGTLNLFVNDELREKGFVTQTSKGLVANLPLFKHETKEIAS